MAFSLGQPGPDLIPGAAVSAALKRVADQVNLQPLAVQYGRGRGPRPFTKAVASLLNQVEEEGVVQTAGNSAALALVASRCIATRNPAEKGVTDVLCEQPTYFLAERILRDSGCTVHPVERKLGYDTVQAFEDTLRAREAQGLLPPAMMYVIPTFHNPTALSYSEEEIRRLIDLAASFGTILVCDEPYNYICYKNSSRAGPIPFSVELVPPEKQRHVISLGSFSKILGPGLRVGFAASHPEVLDSLIIGHGSVASGGGVNPLPGLVVADLIERGEFVQYASILSRELGSRMEMFYTLLQEEGIVLERDPSSMIPEGGYFAWVALGEGGVSQTPVDTSATRFVKACEAEKLSVTPGARCFLGKPATNGSNMARFCLAHTPPRHITKGVRALSRILKML
eukprot:CAMPEP_0184511078 /NCGR_PEP_ID=MMETSP0198_2-20121128/2155_1 /TAXON_ID=1112570 /ORGANISM="Thraustochytrium sp., Strain LLF1b" /LENGTH=396 /DNA_ID=CAMNT_0026901011 /DNA_START=138 /DNA_END=1328 /DNA_ORIENTATION=-